MPSQTDLLNIALGIIGQKRVTSINEDTVAAQWCNTFWPPLRRAILSSARWGCCEWRDELAQDATEPEFEFAYSYALPSDLLVLREYNGDLVNISTVDTIYPQQWIGRFKIEGPYLYTNDGEVKITYTRDVENPALWPPLLFQVGATWLAGQLAGALNKDVALAANKIQEAVSLLLPLAAGIDGQQQTNIPFTTDDLLWGRA